MITALVILAALILLGGLFGSAEPRGRGESRDFNRLHGQWRVRYKDGKLSEPMCKDVAYDYAEMFGGRIIPKNKCDSHHD